MTELALNEAIRKLIELRRNASEKEQERLNTKLTKLYEIKYIMITQKNTLRGEQYVWSRFC